MDFLKRCGDEMRDSGMPYVHIANALAAEDIETLKNVCKRHMLYAGLPCYVLISRLQSSAFLRIKAAVESQIGEALHYLNDFYLYTDSSFKTGWHMDTELFAFQRAVNAWILLSPDCVEDPVGFIAGVNGVNERVFHSVRISGDRCTFGDYYGGDELVDSLSGIEAGQIHTPRVQRGDILLLDPRRFHRTNIASPKHALVIKFVLAECGKVLADRQVDPTLWPEVALFNSLVEGAQSWDEVVARIRKALATPSGRAQLSSGFYPEKFPLYRRMAALL